MNKPFDFKGVRVLNTRPKHLAQATSEKIQLDGGYAIEFPLVAIQGTPAYWKNKLPSLHNLQHAIFTSPNAVTYFFKQIKKWPNTIENYAIGRGTQKALHAQGITTVILPEKADSEHLLQLDALQSLQNHETVLLIKGKDGRTLIQNTLNKRTANLITVSVYERILPEPKPLYAESLWHKDAIDVILITSETALQHLLNLFGEKAVPWLCSKTCLVISERLAAAAKKRGFKTVIVSHANIL